MFTIPMKIPTDQFYSLSVVKSGDGWQANLQAKPGSNVFRIRLGATPEEAIVALFASAPTIIPPPPY